LGEIEVLIIAKDKKNVTEKDIEKAFDEVKSRSMLVLLLSTGEIAKKAKDFYRVHKNIVRFVKIL